MDEVWVNLPVEEIKALLSGVVIKEERGLRAAKCLLLVDCREADLQIFLKKNSKLLT